VYECLQSRVRQHNPKHMGYDAGLKDIAADQVTKSCKAFGVQLQLSRWLHRMQFLPMPAMIA
jgi:hypothetical protein